METINDKFEKYRGMTVNERLYHSGKMEEFDKCRNDDKEKARQILRELGIDSNSIDMILQ